MSEEISVAAIVVAAGSLPASMIRSLSEKTKSENARIRLQNLL